MPYILYFLVLFLTRKASVVALSFTCLLPSSSTLTLHHSINPGRCCCPTDKKTSSFFSCAFLSLLCLICCLSPCTITPHATRHTTALTSCCSTQMGCAWLCVLALVATVAQRVDAATIIAAGTAIDTPTQWTLSVRSDRTLVFVLVYFATGETLETREILG